MPKVLTSRKERAVRLLDIMGAWWCGEKVIVIADAHHISRQMAYRILASVACGWRIRRGKRAHRSDDDADPLPESAVAEARSVVEGRFFTRLTPRQRGALAWRAMGLDMLQTARRMGVFPSTVRDLLIAASWRVERLTREAENRSARKTALNPSLDIGLVDIEALLTPK
jgi:hypothetical protein